MTSSPICSINSVSLELDLLEYNKTKLTPVGIRKKALDREAETNN